MCKTTRAGFERLRARVVEPSVRGAGGGRAADRGAGTRPIWRGSWLRSTEGEARDRVAVAVAHRRGGGVRRVEAGDAVGHRDVLGADIERAGATADDPQLAAGDGARRGRGRDRRRRRRRARARRARAPPSPAARARRRRATSAWRAHRRAGPSRQRRDQRRPSRRAPARRARSASTKAASAARAGRRARRARRRRRGGYAPGRAR